MVKIGLTCRTRLKVSSLVFIRPFQKANVYCRKSMICSQRAQRDGDQSRGERISCRSMIYTRPHNESINYLWTCKIYLRRTLRETMLPYALEVLPSEYALNIMAFPACSYKPQNSFFASGARYPFLKAGCVTLKRQVIFINNFRSHFLSRAIKKIIL